MPTNYTPSTWRQVMAISLFVAVASLGFAANAEALPNTGGTSGEWDIGVYDSCMQHHPPLYTDDDKLDWAISCCVQSGGVWGSGGSCTAPPAEVNSSPVGPPTLVAPPNMAPPNVPNAPTAPTRVSIAHS